MCRAPPLKLVSVRDSVDDELVLVATVLSPMCRFCFRSATQKISCRIPIGRGLVLYC